MTTPAHTQERLHRNIPPITKYPTLFAGRNTHIATVVKPVSMPLEEAEANADRLVTCWNAHDDLLTALVAVRDSGILDAFRDGEADIVASRVRDALAKVGR
jgi:hypothetical protein